MKQLDLQPNTQEWLDARAMFRTASELPIVTGISPFTTKERFKLIKAGLAKQFYSSAMQLGHTTEAATRAWAEQQFGMDFPESVWVRDGYLASLDGFNPEHGIIIEIKCSQHTYNKVVGGESVDYYELQIQQQLYCTGAHTAYLVAFDPKTNQYAMSAPITADPNFKAKADAAWLAFEQLPLPEGPVDASDNQQLERAFRKYAQIKSRIELLEAELEEARQEILEFKAPDRAVQCRGFEIGYRKGSRTVNYKQACTDAKLDLSVYEKVGEPSWTLKLAAPEFEVDEDS